MRKGALILSIMTFCAATVVAQVRSEPEVVDPTQEVKIIVDLTQTGNEWGIVEAAAGGEDMYIWTWKPNEFSAGPKVNGEGSAAWKNSNELLKMTKESEGIYSYTYIPTEFYEVDAKTVYDEDIHFLIKPKDGGGYGDPDVKTEDLMLEIKIPAGPSKVLFSFPNAFGPELDTVKLAMDDIFSIVYDRDEEGKPSLADAENFYFYPTLIGSDDETYKIANNAKKAGEYPQLQMTNNGDGTFQKSLFFSQFADLFNLPDGVTPKNLSAQIVEQKVVNTDNISDKSLEVTFKICP